MDSFEKFNSSPQKLSTSKTDNSEQQFEEMPTGGWQIWDWRCASTTSFLQTSHQGPPLPTNCGSGRPLQAKILPLFPHQPLNHQCSPSEVPLLFMEGCCPDPLWHLKIGQIINDRSEKYFDYHPLIMCWDSSNSLAVTGEIVVFAILGMPCTSKTDEFLEKSQ